MAGAARWQAMRGMIYPRTCMRLRTNLLISTLAIAVTTIAALAQETQKPVEPALPDAPQATAAALIRPNGPTLVMDTSMGRLTCQFFQKEAPKTVANFIALAEGTKDWTDPQTHQKM